MGFLRNVAAVALTGVVVSGIASEARADGIVIPFNVAGILSMDAQGAAGNTVVNLDVAAALGLPSGTPCTMNGIGWEVTLFADPNVGSFGGSWLSEIAVGFSPFGVAAPSFVLRPGAATNTPGTQAYASPVIKLGTVPLPNVDLPNGVLRMQFFETFDDAAGVADGAWVGGNLFIQAVPGPGAVALLGLGGLIATRRRR
jgi:hypothetical protein